MKDKTQISDSLLSWLDKKKTLYIGGEFVNEGTTFESINPATDEPLSEVYAATESLVNSAVKTARGAFEKGEWRQLSADERSIRLKKLGDLILEHHENLSILETLDTGKPIRESSEGDIPRAAKNFHFFAELLPQISNLEWKSGNETHRAYREPIGVVVLITPWNFPLHIATWKIAPALAMGNSVILKPAELTPLTASYFTELIDRAGIPPGVFNLIHGFGEKGAGEWLVSHPDVDAISFTGETTTGRAIMKAASRGPTRVSFEMGGKGAAIVFSDAHFERAIDTCLKSAFRNQGEVCLATPRIFVEKTLYPDFVSTFVERAKAISVGDPLSLNTQMGALISREHWQKVKGYVDEAKGKGKLQTGGKVPSAMSRGNFLEPTIFTDISLEDRISCEEVFGPVVCIYPFQSEAEVLQAANSTQYGLSSTVWTQDNEKAQRIARQLRTGLVWINSWFVRNLNMPFGGQKRSGIGREGGEFSLDFFSDWKSVSTVE